MCNCQPFSIQLFHYDNFMAYAFFPRSGDQLLSVQGNSLENMNHSQAVSLLKGAQGQVTLRVVSWPGTPVWSLTVKLLQANPSNANAGQPIWEKHWTIQGLELFSYVYAELISGILSK